MAQAKYHYVYRITNTLHNIHYYGKRSSILNPSKDIGTKYFSSSIPLKSAIDTLGLFCFKFKILKTFSNASDALAFETYIHNKLNVKDRADFYNLVNQSKTKIDTTGRAMYLNTITGQKEFIKCDDVQDYHIHVNKGKTSVKDKDNNWYWVDISDPRIGTELFFANTGKTTLININDESKVYIDIADRHLYDKHTWISPLSRISKGKLVCKHTITGKIKQLSVNDPRIGTEYVAESTGFAVYKNILTGKNERAKIDDVRIGKELISVTKGYANYRNVETGEYKHLLTTDPRIGKEYVLHSFGHASFIDTMTNKKVWLETSNPEIGTRYISVFKGKTMYKNIYTDKRESLSVDDPLIKDLYVGVVAKKVKCITIDYEIVYLYKKDVRIKNKFARIIK